jgi:hypothetical protein
MISKSIMDVNLLRDQVILPGYIPASVTGN